MQNYKPGTSVPVTFVLADEAGLVLEPTGLRWRVIDADELVIGDWVAIADMPSSSEVTVTVPAQHTVLVAGKLRDLRTVELEVTSVTGTSTLSESILIQGVTGLAFGVNTFQSYPQAILLAEDFTEAQLQGWGMHSRDAREKALIQAYDRIMRLPISTRSNSRDEWYDQSRLTPDTVITNQSFLLRYASIDNLNNLRPALKAALRKAQLVEADEILTNDPIQEARKNGLLSQTTGESSQFFRSAKPLELPVGSRALSYLQQWVRFIGKIGRA